MGSVLLLGVILPCLPAPEPCATGNLIVCLALQRYMLGSGEVECHHLTNLGSQVPIRGLTFSPGGSSIAISGDDSCIKLLAVDTKKVTVLTPPAAVHLSALQSSYNFQWPEYQWG